ncbi:MAG: GntR family transcriptional regulator [Candidatus Dormibacteraeota bacterium]|nr:GntR family transcriptional regulator [Candidatus Dormibacteraeota bacterium]
MPVQVWVTPLLRRRASEEAHDQLRSKILTGELPAGTRLFEATYARNLGISQSTLREALVQLAHEGLVLSVPRRGTYVASLPIDTVQHLYELRERVEPLALRLAMKALSQADLDYLEHQLARLTARSNAERIDADLAFHARLYELSGFAPLQGLWPLMESLTRKFLSMSRRLGSVEKSRQNHRAIMQALVDRDGEALDEAIKDHMRQTSLVLAGRTGPDRKQKRRLERRGERN